MMPYGYDPLQYVPSTAGYERAANMITSAIPSAVKGFTAMRDHEEKTKAEVAQMADFIGKAKDVGVHFTFNPADVASKYGETDEEKKVRVSKLVSGDIQAAVHSGLSPEQVKALQGLVGTFQAGNTAVSDPLAKAALSQPFTNPYRGVTQFSETGPKAAVEGTPGETQEQFDARKAAYGSATLGVPGAAPFTDLGPKAAVEGTPGEVQAQFDARKKVFNEGNPDWVQANTIQTQMQDPTNPMTMAVNQGMNDPSVTPAQMGANMITAQTSNRAYEVKKDHEKKLMERYTGTQEQKIKEWTEKSTYDNARLALMKQEGEVAAINAKAHMITASVAAKNEALQEGRDVAAAMNASSALITKRAGEVDATLSDVYNRMQSLSGSMSGMNTDAAISIPAMKALEEQKTALLAEKTRLGGDESTEGSVLHAIKVSTDAANLFASHYGPQGTATSVTSAAAAAAPTAAVHPGAQIIPTPPPKSAAVPAATPLRPGAGSAYAGKPLAEQIAAFKPLSPAQRAVEMAKLPPAEKNAITAAAMAGAFKP